MNSPFDKKIRNDSRRYEELISAGLSSEEAKKKLFQEIIDQKAKS